MTDFGADAVELVLAACRAGTSEIAGALNRAFDTTLEISVVEPVEFAAAEFDGPGLIVLLKVANRAAVALLPESSGLLPQWCLAPDATGANKLATLAQELGMLVIPEPYLCQEPCAARVDNLLAAIHRGGASDEVTQLRCELVGPSGPATLSIVWPLLHPSQVMGQPSASNEYEPARQPRLIQTTQAPREKTIDELPSYARSLLKIKVPVVVTLATRKQPVAKIVDLGIGSIIHFDKSCEEMIDLEAGGRCIAQGEPVKVGDKFGIRLTSVNLPPESFERVARP